MNVFFLDESGDHHRTRSYRIMNVQCPYLRQQFQFGYSDAKDIFGLDPSEPFRQVYFSLYEEVSQSLLSRQLATEMADKPPPSPYNFRHQRDPRATPSNSVSTRTQSRSRATSSTAKVDTNLTKLFKVQLQEECTERGLPTDGTKDVLIKRIRASMNSVAPSPARPPPSRTSTTVSAQTPRRKSRRNAMTGSDNNSELSNYETPVTRSMRGRRPSDRATTARKKGDVPPRTPATRTLPRRAAAMASRGDFAARSAGTPPHATARKLSMDAETPTRAEKRSKVSSPEENKSKEHSREDADPGREIAADSLTNRRATGTSKRSSGTFTNADLASNPNFVGDHISSALSSDKMQQPTASAMADKTSPSRKKAPRSNTDGRNTVDNASSAREANEISTGRQVESTVPVKSVSEPTEELNQTGTAPHTPPPSMCLESTAAAASPVDSKKREQIPAASGIEQENTPKYFNIAVTYDDTPAKDLAHSQAASRLPRFSFPSKFVLDDKSSADVHKSTAVLPDGQPLDMEHSVAKIPQEKGNISESKSGAPVEEGKEIAQPSTQLEKSHRGEGSDASPALSAMAADKKVLEIADTAGSQLQKSVPNCHAPEIEVESKSIEQSLERNQGDPMISDKTSVKPSLPMSEGIETPGPPSATEEPVSAVFANPKAGKSVTSAKSSPFIPSLLKETRIEEAPLQEEVAEKVHEQGSVEEGLVEATVEEAAVEVAAVAEATIPEASIIPEMSMEAAPVEVAPVEEAPVEEAPVEEATVEKATVEKATVEKATVEEAPVEAAPIETVPEETLVEEDHVEEGPANMLSGKETHKQIVMSTTSDPKDSKSDADMEAICLSLSSEKPTNSTSPSSTDDRDEVTVENRSGKTPVHLNRLLAVEEKEGEELQGQSEPDDDVEMVPCDKSNDISSAEEDGDSEDDHENSVEEIRSTDTQQGKSIEGERPSLGECPEDKRGDGVSNILVPDGDSQSLPDEQAQFSPSSSSVEENVEERSIECSGDVEVIQIDDNGEENSASFPVAVVPGEDSEELESLDVGELEDGGGLQAHPNNGNVNIEEHQVDVIPMEDDSLPEYEEDESRSNAEDAPHVFQSSDRNRTVPDVPTASGERGGAGVFDAVSPGLSNGLPADETLAGRKRPREDGVAADMIDDNDDYAVERFVERSNVRKKQKLEDVVKQLHKVMPTPDATIEEIVREGNIAIRDRVEEDRKLMAGSAEKKRSSLLERLSKLEGATVQSSLFQEDDVKGGLPSPLASMSLFHMGTTFVPARNRRPMATEGRGRMRPVGMGSVITRRIQARGLWDSAQLAEHSSKRAAELSCEVQKWRRLEGPDGIKRNSFLPNVAFSTRGRKPVSRF